MIGNASSSWEIFISYVGAADMLLHRYGKFTFWKVYSYLVSQNFVFNLPSISRIRCKSKYDAECGVLHFKIDAIEALNAVTKLWITRNFSERSSIVYSRK